MLVLVGGYDGAPLVRLAQPVEHLGARLELGEAGQHVLHALRQAGVGRDAPVLAPPVEPAAGQLLDGLVDLVVDREAEDELTLAGVVVEEVNARIAQDRARLAGREEISSLPCLEWPRRPTSPSRSAGSSRPSGGPGR